MVPRLRNLTSLDDTTVQRRLHGTRKYGIHYQDWGRANRDFIHHFFPIDEAYGYHLSTDGLVDLLRKSIRARRVDAQVTAVTRIDNGTRIQFDGRTAERFDFVIDARGFPHRLNRRDHIRVSFIPTNTALLRRGPPTAVDVTHTYTRAVARPHGWVFVIPLAGHTSYGYVFNRYITSVEETERDFDTFMEKEDVSAFERRGVIRFHNFIQRRIYDGFLARIGNAAGFMEPLEASALYLTQSQIHWILNHRLSELAERGRGYAALVNQWLVRNTWRLGVFISWHYSQGSTYDTAFWKHAREEAWPRHLAPVHDPAINAATESRLLHDLIDRAIGQRDGGSEPRPAIRGYAGFHLKSFRNMAGGLGYLDVDRESAWWLPDGRQSAGLEP